ncbi:unnamed protein product, partial [Vitis vinifera]
MSLGTCKPNIKKIAFECEPTPKQQQVKPYKKWGLLYKFGFKNASAVVLTVVEGQQGAPAMVLLSQH